MLCFYFVLGQSHGTHLIIAPRLVADTPQLNVVGGRVPVLRTPFTHRRAGCTVCVLHQLAGGPGIAKSCVDRDVWVNTNQSAKRQKFVGAHVVRLQSVPHGVEDGGSLVDITPPRAATRKKKRSFRPGRRKTPKRICFSTEMTSGRNPLMLSAGISDTAPT